MFVLEFVVELSVTSSTAAFSGLSINRIPKQFCKVSGFCMWSHAYDDSCLCHFFPYLIGGLKLLLLSPISHVWICFHLFLCCFVYLSLSISLCACCLSACQFFLCLYHFIIEPICVENRIFGCLLFFYYFFLLFLSFCSLRLMRMKLALLGVPGILDLAFRRSRDAFCVCLSVHLSAGL